MDSQRDGLDREPRRWLPWVLGGLLGCVLCAVLVCAGVLILGRAMLSRFVDGIDVDRPGLKAAIEQGVVRTLEEGDAEQRVELLGQLAQMGADARPFVPQVVECTKDDDPKVRAAAIRALRAIDPAAADELQSETDFGKEIPRGGEKDRGVDEKSEDTS